MLWQPFGLKLWAKFLLLLTTNHCNLIFDLFHPKPKSFSNITSQPFPSFDTKNISAIDSTEGKSFLCFLMKENCAVSNCEKWRKTRINLIWPSLSLSSPRDDGGEEGGHTGKFINSARKFSPWKFIFCYVKNWKLCLRMRENIVSFNCESIICVLSGGREWEREKEK